VLSASLSATSLEAQRRGAVYSQERLLSRTVKQIGEHASCFGCGETSCGWRSGVVRASAREGRQGERPGGAQAARPPFRAPARITHDGQPQHYCPSTPKTWGMLHLCSSGAAGSVFAWHVGPLGLLRYLYCECM